MCCHDSDQGWPPATPPQDRGPALGGGNMTHCTRLSTLRDSDGLGKTRSGFLASFCQALLRLQSLIKFSRCLNTLVFSWILQLRFHLLYTVHWNSSFMIIFNCWFLPFTVHQWCNIFHRVAKKLHLNDFLWIEIQISTHSPPSRSQWLSESDDTLSLLNTIFNFSLGLAMVTWNNTAKVNHLKIFSRMNMFFPSSLQISVFDWWEKVHRF